MTDPFGPDSVRCGSSQTLEGNDEDALRPTVWLGSSGGDSTIVWNGADGTILDGRDFGTSDFALEFWVKRLFPDSITNWGWGGAGNFGYCLSGVIASSTGNSPDFTPGGSAVSSNIAGGWIEMNDGAFKAVYVSDPAAPPTTYGSVTGTLGMGWHHIAVNYDRSGNMELFIDGVSQGTDAIDATDLGAAAGNANALGTHLCLSDNSTGQGKVEIPYCIGGFALHVNTLMTTAQIQDSIANGTVYIGDGTTTRVAFLTHQIRTTLGPGWDDSSLNQDLTPDSALDGYGVFTTTLYSTADGNTGSNTLSQDQAAIAADYPYPVVVVGRSDGVELPEWDDSTDDVGNNGTSNVKCYAYIPNLSDEVTGVSRPIGIYGVFSYVDGGGAANVDAPSPLFGRDPTWPLKKSGVPYA